MLHGGIFKNTPFSRKPKILPPESYPGYSPFLLVKVTPLEENRLAHVLEDAGLCPGALGHGHLLPGGLHRGLDLVHFPCYSDFILDRSHKLVGLQSLAACVEEPMRKVFRLNFSIVVTFMIITFIYTTAQRPPGLLATGKSR